MMRTQNTHDMSGVTCKDGSHLSDMLQGNGGGYDEILSIAGEKLAQDLIPPEYTNRLSRVGWYDFYGKTEVKFHFLYCRWSKKLRRVQHAGVGVVQSGRAK